MVIDWDALLRELPAVKEPVDASPQARQRALEGARRNPFDVAVIGGGITGSAVAAALAERGVHVVLLERGDIAGETSMTSGNAIWGGFKYLANGQLHLVATSCRQRRQFVHLVPHLVRHVPYLMPCYKDDPYRLWTRWWGARFYHWLGGGTRHTPPPAYFGSAEAVLRQDARLRPDGLIGGLRYAEAETLTSDAHFTLQFALTAAANGATVLTRTAVETIRRDADGLVIGCRDRIGESEFELRARRLVNAGGPWADDINRLAGIREGRYALILRRGIWIIVPPQALCPAGSPQVPTHFLTYFCYGEDRPFFLAPWGPCVMVGTTDVPHEPEALDRIEPSEEELRFVLQQVGARLLPPPKPLQEQIIALRVGVRPLAVTRRRAMARDGRDALALSRDHKIGCSDDGLVTTIYGGKLTPCRAIAQEVADTLARPSRKPVLETLYSALPYRPLAELEDAVRQTMADRKVDHEILTSTVSQFGTCASDVLGLARCAPILMQRPYPTLPYTWADLVHNARNRWVISVDDLLRRRTNIAQWVPRGGFGVSGEYEPVVAEIAALVAAVTRTDVHEQLEQYRQLVDHRERWRAWV